MKKKENLAGMSAADLKKKADELRVKLHSVTYSLMAGRNKNHKEGAMIRKDIARIETILAGKTQ